MAAHKSKEGGELRATPRQLIIRELQAFLAKARLRHIYFADDSLPAPALAYVTHFPRLSISLHGDHCMQLARAGRQESVCLGRQHAVFVPANAWNRPDWSGPARVLTFLFGSRHIGVSMVKHSATAVKKPNAALEAVKTHIDGAYDRLTQNILNALSAFAADPRDEPLARLLTESLLRACLLLLKNPEQQPPRKALRTFHSICLYVQENFAHPLTRESVARHFGLAPNHVSRLFRNEGLVRFNDYLNFVRVSRAKYLLRKSKVGMKEIAASCGYADVPYFCRVFKRVAKATPSQYRGSRLDDPAAGKGDG